MTKNEIRLELTKILLDSNLSFESMTEFAETLNDLMDDYDCEPVVSERSHDDDEPYDVELIRWMKSTKLTERILKYWKDDSWHNSCVGLCTIVTAVQSEVGANASVYDMYKMGGDKLSKCNSLGRKRIRYIEAWLQDKGVDINSDILWCYGR